MKFFGVLFCGVLALSLGACVKAVTTTAGVATKATTTAVGVGGDVAEAGVNAATPDKKEKKRKKKRKSKHHDGPFDAARNASADVDAAFDVAAESGKNVLLVLGGNWCHDSRGLAEKFDIPPLTDVIARGYELVWVDVGYRDRNLDIAERFGVNQLYGTPTVLILSPTGELLNGDSVHDWRTADSTPYDVTLSYFKGFAGGR